MVKIYTRKGDDGTTGLLYGGPRVAKDSPVIEANGVVDEAQAVIGLARAEAAPDGELDPPARRRGTRSLGPHGRGGHRPGQPEEAPSGAVLVTPEMVAALEGHIDELNERFDMPTEFVVPGPNRVAALLDVARTVVRRGERLRGVGMAGIDSQVGPYLNRLSDLLWTMARWRGGRTTSCPGARRRRSATASTPGPTRRPAGPESHRHDEDRHRGGRLPS